MPELAFDEIILPDEEEKKPDFTDFDEIIPPAPLMDYTQPRTVAPKEPGVGAVVPSEEPLPPEYLTSAGIPSIPQQQGNVAQVAAGIGNVPIGFANFLLSPTGIATLAMTGGLPKAAQTLIGAGFTADQVKEFFQAKTLQEKITSGVGAGLLGYGTIKGAKAKRANEADLKSAEAAPEKFDEIIPPPDLQGAETRLPVEPIEIPAAETSNIKPQPSNIDYASQIPDATRVPEPEIRPQVGEETPLRQQGETTEAPPQETVKKPAFLVVTQDSKTGKMTLREPVKTMDEALDELLKFYEDNEQALIKAGVLSPRAGAAEGIAAKTTDIKTGKTTWTIPNAPQFTDIEQLKRFIVLPYIQTSAQPEPQTAVDPEAVAAANIEGLKAIEAETPFGFGPGAAAAGEKLRPNEPTAKQLADLVEGVTTGDPNRFALQIGRTVEQFSRARTGVERAFQTVGSLARGFKRIIWDAPTPTNFDHWKGKWDSSLQYNDFHIKRLGNELERAMPNRKRQEALYNWAAAEGNEALLREWADKAPPDVRQGYLDALTLTNEEKRLGNLQRGAYDEWLARAVEHGMLKDGVENYLKRIVIKRPEIADDLRAKMHTGRLSTNFRESKRRFWDAMVDAERAGIRYDKSIRGQSLYAQSFEHAAINRTAMRQFFDSETENGRPFAIVEGMGIPVEGTEQRSPSLMVTPYGARNVRGAKALAEQLQAKYSTWSEAKALAIAKEKILSEYEPFDHPAFKNWQWTHTLEDGTQIFVRGDALVHSSMVPKLRNAFTKDRLDWLAPILRTQGFVKGSKLSLSLFHNLHEVVLAAGHLTNPANLKPLGAYLEMPEIRAGMEAGLKLVGSAHEQAHFAEGMGSHGWPELVPLLGDYVKAFKDATFEDWIPRIKAEAYLRALERNEKGGPTRLRPTKKLTPEQNAIITARQINASFGEQNYRQMMRDPRLQQTLQGLFLAPDFGESKLRHIGQTVTRYGGEQRMALGLVAAGLYIGSRILNQVFSGNPQWNKPFSVVVGDREYTIRSLPGDLAHLLSSPTSYLMHRLSPGVQTGIEWLFHRDAHGQVVDWSDQVKDTLLSAVPIPLTHRQGLRWKDQLASAMGITPMQYRSENELRKLIIDFKKNSNDPKLVHEMERGEKETFLPSDYALLRAALRDGNLDRAAEEYAKLTLLKGGRVRIYRAMSDWKDAPFTGSRRVEMKFRNTLTAEQRELYTKARDERKLVWQNFLKMRSALLPGRILPSERAKVF